ncbi:hypothetical protein [Streptomyces sp. SCSIO ZS0520]|uniref:hypothetical protein n=1 Tax=Streptomyces sp. SCSIO ZS0520 TaxID=2892996 RepID=UPI0021D9D254|nr:hypothetical protein [Streptomyces sp. SCSIO ZS0520]
MPRLPRPTRPNRPAPYRFTGGTAVLTGAASGIGEAEDREGKDASARLLTHPPDRAAELILRGVHRRRARVLISWTAHAPRRTPTPLPRLVLDGAEPPRPGCGTERRFTARRAGGERGARRRGAGQRGLRPGGSGV